MSVELVLSRLEGVQKSGSGWRARCPSCGGKSRKVSLTEVDDGRVLIHGFCGCSATEIVQAAGLTIADLFPEPLAADTPDERRRRQRLAREARWGAALEALAHEARVVAIVAADIIHGRPISPEDYNRTCEAVERIAEAEQVLSDKPAARTKAALREAAERFARDVA